MESTMPIGSQQENCKEIIYSNEYADYIFQRISNGFFFYEEFDLDCEQPIDSNYSVIYARITATHPASINTFGYAAFPACYGLLDTSNMESAGVLRLRRQPFLNLLGRDVIIGIIDTGIDYNHPVFKNADNTTRILSIWDQTQQEGTPPEGFLYGNEYSRERINELIQWKSNQNTDMDESDIGMQDTLDENGHGTFIAGIAAGGEEPSDDFTGVAPLADIVVVKLKEAKQYLKEYYKIKEEAVCYQENDIILALEYMRGAHRKYNKPIAVCMSVGSSMGDHETGNYLSEYMDRMADSIGETIVVASGNEGNAGHHFFGRINPGSEYQEVELRVGPNERGFTIELWASAPYLFAVAIISPRGEYIAKIPVSFNKSTVVPLVLEQAVIYIDYVMVEGRTGEFLIFMRFQTPTEGIWTLRVHDEAGIGGEYHIWLPMREFISDATYFISPEPNTTLCDPANTNRTITTSAYNHVNNNIDINSSRGYTRLGRIKPDFAAPGVDVFGPVPGGGYARKTGSSIAAAHGTGAAALLLEWGIVEDHYPYMRNVDVGKILIRGSNRLGRYNYPNQQWGYGTLDVFGGIDNLV